MSQRSQMAEGFGICVRIRFAQNLVDRNVGSEIMGIDPAQDRGIAFRKFERDLIARFEAQALPSLSRNRDLTFGRKSAARFRPFDFPRLT